MYVYGMEIKKREIIFSIAIISLMLIIGSSISGKIRESLLEQYQEYDTAVHLDSEDMFRHGMDVNIGNAFVYGDLKALDPVSFPEIEGEYSYIRKEEQEYRNHPRPTTKTYTDSNGKTKTKTEMEDHWTWDIMRTDTKTATRISFLNVEFEYGKIPFPSSHELKIISTGYHRRNVYYGTDTDFQGTIFSNLKNDTINKTSFYKNRTIEETIAHLESGGELVLFWILWILLIAVCVFVFYYAENRWLD